jgi:hypothetical protein
MMQAFHPQGGGRRGESAMNAFSRFNLMDSMKTQSSARRSHAGTVATLVLIR